MLEIDMEFKKGILIVRIKGRLDINTYHQLDKELNDIVVNNGIKYLLLNITNLDYLDEYGLKVIRNNYINIMKNKGKLLLCGTDKILDYNININDTLYQIKKEEGAFQLIQI